MAISPLEMNGMITRTQDYSAMKHNENSKGAIDQNNLQNQFTKTVDQHIKTVHNPDDAQYHQYGYDSKEKGNNEYTGDGGKNRKKKKEKNEGKVIVKDKKSFDMKI
ncbi:hypothetical protein D7X25_25810 [bacterium 1XD42-8]|nr:hypothetical protein D7X25_25810 [bacterium 1XD42-8]